MCRREKEGPSGEPLVRSSGTRGVTAIRRQGKDEWDKKDGCVCLPFAVCGLIPVHPRQPLSITPSLGCVLMVSVVGRQCYWFCEESWLRRDLKNGVMAGGSHRKDSLSFFFFNWESDGHFSSKGLKTLERMIEDREAKLQEKGDSNMLRNLVLDKCTISVPQHDQGG